MGLEASNSKPPGLIALVFRMVMVIGAISISFEGNPSSGGGSSTPWPEIRDVWDFSNLDGSELRFRELAERAEGAGDAVFHAEVMTQIARIHGLRGEFDQALAMLDLVESGMVSDNPRTQVHVVSIDRVPRRVNVADSPRVRVRVLLERGRALNTSGENDQALTLFVQAFELASQNNEAFLAGDAAHMAGIAADISGEQRWMQSLLALAVSNPDSEAAYWVGPMRNNLGWSYFFDEQYDKAIPEFEASREAYSLQPGKRVETLIADYARGRVMRAQGRCSEALPTQEATYEALRSEFDMEDEYVLEEIALCRAALGDTSGARAPAALALEKLSQDVSVVENEPDRLAALRSIATGHEARSPTDSR